MSRIRTVKPDFWVSEQVLSCSPLARLLFIGMWNFCDDHGVHPASFVRLKAEVFPGDDIAIDKMKSWVGELISARLVRAYDANDKAYWIVTGWKDHQRIDRPTYKYPLPSPVNDKDTDASSNTLRSIDDYSTTDRNGMDRNGMEKDISEVETSPASASIHSPTGAAKVVFEHWQQKMNHPKAKFDKKRERLIAQAMQLGYTVDDLKQAIDGCENTPFNMGQNDRYQRYDDLGLILRDADHIDRFMKNSTSDHKSQTSETDLMAGVL